jgi:hypothetical protein
VGIVTFTHFTCQPAAPSKTAIRKINQLKASNPTGTGLFLASVTMLRRGLALCPSKDRAEAARDYLVLATVEIAIYEPC